MPYPRGRARLPSTTHFPTQNPAVASVTAPSSVLSPQGTQELDVLKVCFRNPKTRSDFDLYLRGHRNAICRILAHMATFVAVVDVLDAIVNYRRRRWVHVVSASVLGAVGIVAPHSGLQSSTWIGGMLLCVMMVLELSLVGLFPFHSSRGADGEPQLVRYGFEFLLASGVIIVSCISVHPPAAFVAVLVTIPPASFTFWGFKTGITETTQIVHMELVGFWLFVVGSIWLQMRNNCQIFDLVCKLKGLREKQVGTAGVHKRTHKNFYPMQLGQI